MRSQGLVHFSYSWHIFEKLAFLCESTPDLSSSNRNGVINFNRPAIAGYYLCLTEF
jgi:hypothetical protein